MFLKRNIHARINYNIRLKGGALYISIIVSIIIGILLSFLILIGRYNQSTATLFLQSSQLYTNLQSGFDIAQSDYFNEEMNATWIKNEFNDDSLKIIKRFWGAYLLLSVTTKNRHHLLSQSGLYGTFMTGDTALAVSDNSRPVGLSGQIVFKANCYLPKPGIKPAFIEGQNYISTAANSAFIKQSHNSIPELQTEFIKGLKEQRSEKNNANDSSSLETPQTINRPFSKSTVSWRTPLIKLSGLNLSNNVRIIADEVELDSSCHLNNISLICKKVRFKEGFHGKIHVLASDSIVIEKNCSFYFPSSFVLFPEEDPSALSKLRCIVFNEGCQFFGAVMAVEDKSLEDQKQQVLIKLNAKSEVNGLIYSSDFIHVEGQLNATVMCDKLLIKTASAVYENSLLGCTIDPKKYSQSLAVPLAFRKGKLLCCEKMN